MQFFDLLFKKWQKTQETMTHTCTHTLKRGTGSFVSYPGHRGRSCEWWSRTCSPPHRCSFLCLKERRSPSPGSSADVSTNQRNTTYHQPGQTLTFQTQISLKSLPGHLSALFIWKLLPSSPWCPRCGALLWIHVHFWASGCSAWGCPWPGNETSPCCLREQHTASSPYAGCGSSRDLYGQRPANELFVWMIGGSLEVELY